MKVYLLFAPPFVKPVQLLATPSPLKPPSKLPFARNSAFAPMVTVLDTVADLPAASVSVAFKVTVPALAGVHENRCWMASAPVVNARLPIVELFAIKFTDVTPTSLLALTVSTTVRPAVRVPGTSRDTLGFAVSDGVVPIRLTLSTLKSTSRLPVGHFFQTRMKIVSRLPVGVMLVVNFVNAPGDRRS